MGDPAIGSTLAGYRIDALIARGGMGVVYRATHLALDRPVALKVIARDLAEKEGFRDRFLRESRLAARLDHPGVVPVFDAREEDGELIVAMRLVNGSDLRQLIDREGPLEPARAVALLGQVAEALDAAHAAGIVHRDVKPHNILVEGDRAYLTDFGLAKAVEESGVHSGASVVGTVEYMSPEQWRGASVGTAADVYSLGCVLYEALTGVVPYARKAGDAEPELPKGLDAVIERAVAPDPAERYPSAGALIAAARERQGGTPTATRVLTDTLDRPTMPLGGAQDGGGVGLSRWRRFFAAGFLVWFISGTAIVGTAVGVALLLLRGDDVSVSSPISVGEGPLRLTTSPGAVWVTSATDGTLSRIDPDTRKVVDTMRIGKGASGVAVGYGFVWVTRPSTGEVFLVDPERPAAQRPERIAVGGRPGAIALAGGRAWVADEAGGGVTAINAQGPRVYKRRIAPQAPPLRLAAGAGGLWVSSAASATIRRIDLGDAVAGPTIAVGRGPSGITVAGGIVWVANSRGDTVTRVDPVTGVPFGERIPVGDRPGGIDAGTDTVWVANNGDDSVTRIDIRDGDPVGDPVGVGPAPGAVAVGEKAVWVANNGDGTVTRIEP
jgi:DNA-binding beta-propeller fold protein YncE/predicted Ser/Thr protein kinase